MGEIFSGLILWAVTIGSAVAGWRRGRWSGLAPGFLAGIRPDLCAIGVASLLRVALIFLQGRRSGTGKLMIAAPVVAAWLDLTLAMVRHSKTASQRDRAVALAVLGPIAMTAEMLAFRWLDRRSDRGK